MKIKINIDKIKIVLICLTFYEPPIMPHFLFLAFKYLLILYVIWRYFYIVGQIRNTIIPIIFYGFITVVSTIFNGMSFNTIIASFFFSLHIVSVFILSMYMISEYSLKVFLNFLLRLFLTICFFTDILMLFIDYNFSNPSEAYLFGNKFVVSYLHCFTAALFFACTRDIRVNRGFVVNGNIIINRLLAYFFALYSVAICKVVSCSTGMVATAVMILIVMAPKHIVKLFSSGKVMIICIGIITILMFGPYSLLKNPYILDFVQNTLGKSPSFTGRIQIWNMIFDVIANNPIIGYGYYNNIVEVTLGYGNPQNGVLKLLVDTGIIGLVLYIMVVIKVFKKMDFRIKDMEKEVLPIIAFFYAMIIASLVEINLTHMIVFLAMAIVNAAYYNSTHYAMPYNI